MFGIDVDLGPRVEPERGGPFVGAEAEERARIADLPPPRRAARSRFELSKLLEGVDPDVRVGADADPDAALAQALEGGEAGTQIGLGRRADADSAPRGRQQVELAVVGMRGVDDRASGAEAARLV